MGVVLLPLYIAIIVGPSATALSGAQNSDFPRRKSAPNRYCSTITKQQIKHLLRAHTLYSTVADSFDELESLGKIGHWKKTDHSSFFINSFLFVHFFALSQKTPCQDHSTVQYSGLALIILDSLFTLDLFSSLI